MAIRKRCDLRQMRNADHLPIAREVFQLFTHGIRRTPPMPISISSNTIVVHSCASANAARNPSSARDAHPSMHLLDRHQRLTRIERNIERHRIAPCKIHLLLIDPDAESRIEESQRTQSFGSAFSILLAQMRGSRSASSPARRDARTQDQRGRDRRPRSVAPLSVVNSASHSD